MRPLPRLTTRLTHLVLILLALLPQAFAEPAPEPAPKPIAEAKPEPVADADPNAQQSVYAPFSGAIYIVNGDGTGYSNAAPAVCPNNGMQGCANINVYNWCCPTGCTCALLSNGAVGCCPAGASCSGTVNAAAISTVTVQQVVTSYVQPQVTTVPVIVPGGVYVQATSKQPAVYNGYCSTLYAHGPGLPTTAAGACGTILVLNGAERVGGRGWVVLGVVWPGVLIVGMVLGMGRWV